MKKIHITRLVISPFASNCYIVRNSDNDQATVIDPGGEPDLILKTIEDQNLDLAHILLTHGHIDHITAVSTLTKRFDVPVNAHQEERQILEAAPMQAQMFGLPPVAAPTITDWFKDADILTINGLNFQVIHTPGHSPGGSCFLLQEDIFVGDTLFESSIGRTDLPGGNFQQLIHSIKTQLLTLPDELIVHPGHGESTTLGQEKKLNPFLQGI